MRRRLLPRPPPHRSLLREVPPDALETRDASGQTLLMSACRVHAEVRAYQTAFPLARRHDRCRLHCIVEPWARCFPSSGAAVCVHTRDVHQGVHARPYRCWVCRGRLCSQGVWPSPPILPAPPLPPAPFGAAHHKVPVRSRGAAEQQGRVGCDSAAPSARSKAPLQPAGDAGGLQLCCHLLAAARRCSFQPAVAR
jgi:hypothetical protein